LISNLKVLILVPLLYIIMACCIKCQSYTKCPSRSGCCNGCNYFRNGECIYDEDDTEKKLSKKIDWQISTVKFENSGLEQIYKDDFQQIPNIEG